MAFSDDLYLSSKTNVVFITFFIFNISFVNIKIYSIFEESIIFDFRVLNKLKELERG